MLFGSTGQINLFWFVVTLKKKIYLSHSYLLIFKFSPKEWGEFFISDSTEDEVFRKGFTKSKSSIVYRNRYTLLFENVGSFNVWRNWIRVIFRCFIVYRHFQWLTFRTGKYPKLPRESENEWRKKYYKKPLNLATAFSLLWKPWSFYINWH